MCNAIMKRVMEQQTLDGNNEICVAMINYERY